MIKRFTWILCALNHNPQVMGDIILTS